LLQTVAAAKRKTFLISQVGIGEGDFIMSTAEDGLGVATAISKAGKLNPSQLSYLSFIQLDVNILI
jgi:hypothetical protein